jgi:tetratricopeptide (TPR) repeat protein
MAQRYDDLGFPIPAEFDLHDAEPTARKGRSRPRRLKMMLLGLVAAALVPAVVLPEVAPVARQLVVRWSLARAMALEARDDVHGAVKELERAVAWHGDDAELLCLRAMLRLEDRSARKALADADRAVALAPTSVEPYRVRALIRVCLEEPEAALADAAMVVELSGEGNPESLNLRAYVRGLVDRELDEGLADIDRAIARIGPPSAEMLDTRGYLLWRLGRHEEALLEMNRAIDLVRQQRRQLMLLAGRIGRDDLLGRMRTIDHGMAVMLQHRGLVCKSLGIDEQAAEDFRLAAQKGYDPSRGIF